jgi:hypothetical protein
MLAAWHLSSPDIVEKSFKVTRISNEMDGTEDFIISDIDNTCESDG